MTTEEAIKIFEAWAECKDRPTHDAAVLALSALRAQQERENPKQITNADRIRAMSDEELAVWLCDLFSVDTCYTHCPGCDSCNDAGGLSNGLKKWLQQPAEEG